MSRTRKLSLEQAQDETKTFFDVLQRKLGRVPNIFLHMGISPSALKAYRGLKDAEEASVLSPLLREQIALVVGQANNCAYCLSAHSAIGKSLGLSDSDIKKARAGESTDTKNSAILSFAKTLTEKKAHLTQAEIDTLKAAGVSDQELIEIIVTVVSNIFTNYFNHIVDPEIDFPKAPT